MQHVAQEPGRFVIEIVARGHHIVLLFDRHAIELVAFDGAASLDVLLFVPDKAKALREITRVLKPNACFAGTTFELGSSSAALAAPAFVDYPGAFTAAGFAIEVYEEAAGWRKLLEDVTAHILEREPDISREIHPQALSRVLKWARTRPPELADSRRVKFCVRKPL